MKLRNFIIAVACCALFLNMQCDEDDVTVAMNCDENTIVDNSAYQNSDSAFYNFLSAEVDQDCLIVEISSSGCDGSTWDMELIDSGDILESLPLQRNLKLVLTNNEACLAVFSKEQSFDLTPIRIEGNNEIVLNIEGFPEPITYSY